MVLPEASIIGYWILGAFLGIVLTITKALDVTYMAVTVSLFHICECVSNNNAVFLCAPGSR